MIGGLAGTCGGFVSNPFEVIKIRQQLQGELQNTAKSQHHRPYGTLWMSVKTIARAEGVLALQKGCTFSIKICSVSIAERSTENDNLQGKRIISRGNANFHGKKSFHGEMHIFTGN